MWLSFCWFLHCFSFTWLSYIMASWNFSLKCKQGIIYVHHRVKKSPNSSSSCLSNILKKQNRAQAQFFFAFQVSFKSRDSHDAAILEVEASKCFTSCKHSSKLLQITYYLRRLVEEPQLLPLSWICFVWCCVRKNIFKLLFNIDRFHISYTLLQYPVGVKICSSNIERFFVITVVEVFSFELIYKMKIYWVGHKWFFFTEKKKCRLFLTLSCWCSNQLFGILTMDNWTTSHVLVQNL